VRKSFACAKGSKNDRFGSCSIAIDNPLKVLRRKLAKSIIQEVRGS